MSLRLGTTLIAGLTELSEMANTDLSNLSATGQAVIDGKADNTLQNLTNVGKLVLDGQWAAPSTTTIASSVSGDSTYSNEFDLSSFLPDDGQLYDCLFYINGRTGTTSGNHFRAYLSSSEARTMVLDATTRTSSYVNGAGCCILPIGTNRKLTMTFEYSGGTNTDVELKMAAYRRVGTNS